MFNKFLKFTSMVVLLCSFVVGQEDYQDVLKRLERNVSEIRKGNVSLENCKEVISDITKLPEETQEQLKDLNASINSHIGSLLCKDEKFNEALKYTKRALKIYEELYLPPNYKIATCYSLLSILYVQCGEFSKAKDVGRIAVVQLEKAYKKDTSVHVLHALADAYSNMAQAEDHLFNYKEAQKQYNKSLEQYIKLGYKENIATCFLKLSRVNLELAKIEKDAKFLQEALKYNKKDLILRRKYDLNIDESVVLRDAIHAFLEKAKILEKPEQRESLTLETFGDKKTSKQATIYNDKGVLLVNEGKYREGLEYYERALKIYNQVYKSMEFIHPSIATVQINIAIALFHLGRFKDAKEMAEKAYEASKKLFEIRWPTLQTRLKIRHDEEYFDRCLAVFLSLSKEFPSQEILSKYLSAVVYHKNVVTRVLSLERKIAETVKDDTKLQKVYEDYQTTLRNFIERSYGEEDTNFDNVIKKKERLEAKLSKEIRGILGETIPNVNPAQIQEKILGHTAILEYVTYFDHNQMEIGFGVFVIRKKKIDFFPLGNSQDIQNQVEVFRQIIQSKTDINKVLKHSEALYGKLFPLDLRQFLSNVNTLFVSPDDALHFLPFAALWTQNKKYLVEEYKLAYLASSEILLKEPQKKYGQEMYIVGNPDFDLNLSDDEVADVTKEWEALRQSKEEFLSVKLLQQKLSKKEPLYLRKDKEALKQHFVETFTKNNDVYWIHILSHASNKLAISNTNLEYAQEFEPLVRFGIVFAGANCKNNSPNQYLLTAADIILFKLKNKCTVLSCCETAIGPDLSGVGIYNFKWSFSYAGSENLLLSLWKISDKDTPTLMNRFYEKMSLDLQPWEVLVETQRELISEKEFSHPYFWSTFICQTNNIQPTQNTTNTQPTAKGKWYLYVIALIFGSIVFCGFYLLLKKKK